MSRLFGWAMEERAASPAAHPSMHAGPFWGGEVVENSVLTERGAMAHSAVYQAVQIISVMLASMPRHVMRRTNDGRVRDRESWLNRPLTDPNPEMTLSSFWVTMYVSKLLWGTAYAEIEFDNSGLPLYLWPLDSSKVTQRRVYKGRDGKPTFEVTGATDASRARGGRIAYEVRDGAGGAVYLHADQVFVLPDLSWNGRVGMSRIRAAAAPIVAGLSAQQSVVSLFRNGSMPAGVIERPADAPALDPKGVSRRLAAWEGQLRGTRKAGRVAVLQEGETYRSITIPPRDAQLLELAQLSVLNVAHLFNLAPYWFGHPGSSKTYSNVETEWIGLERRTLSPHMVAEEQEVRRSLIPVNERGVIWAKIENKALLRADSKTRAEVQAKWVEMGALNAAEVARLEDLPPVPDEQGGSTYRWPTSQAPAGVASPEKLAEGADEARAILEDATEERSSVVVDRAARREFLQRRSVSQRRRLREIWRAPLQSALGRLSRAEARALRRALQKAENAADFARFTVEFYETFRGTFEEGVGDLLAAYVRSVAAEAALEVDADPQAEAIADAIEAEASRYVAFYAAGYVARRRAAMTKRLQEGAWAELAESYLERVEESAALEASSLVVRAGTPAAKTAYRAAGHRRTVWVGGDCPLCSAMNGRTVEIGSAYLSPGDELDPGDEETTPLSVQRIIDGPPLHGECDCIEVAD